MKQKLLFYTFSFFILLSLAMTSCSKDDDDEPMPSRSNAPFQIIVVFAPGQLGDKGYADDVIAGLNSLDDFDNNLGGDSLDVRFIAPRNLEDVRKWVASGSATDTYTKENYERRLLVLTEPYMVKLLPNIKDELKPTDELLIMKLEEDDIAQIAQLYSLGNHVHGLNIPASASARKFCQYIRRWVQNSNIPESQMIQIPVYRLYENTAYPYRDGMMEAIQQEMGGRVEFVSYGLSSMEDIGLFMQGSTQTMVEAAFEAAQSAQLSAESAGCPCVFVDLGAGNTGWDYYLLSQAYSLGSLWTLMLDAQEARRLNRFYISRHFGKALEDWVWDWMSKPVGTMEPQVTLDDAFYYKDNIFEIENP